MTTQIEKVFVKMTMEDSEDKSLSTFVHFPSNIPPLTQPPSTDIAQRERRIACLILHPHPKIGGNAQNNVVDFLSHILSNGQYLTYVDKHDKTPQLYDVSYMGHKTQRRDLTTNPQTGQLISQICGPLSRQFIPSPYDYLPKTALSSHEQQSGDQTQQGGKNDKKNKNNNDKNDNDGNNNNNNNGIITIRFNTSGVDDSDGKSTWTGSMTTEVEDVITILRWIFHPQSRIFPTDLFIIGYSFGSCILASALNRIFLSNSTDESAKDVYYDTKDTILAYQALSKHLYHTLRGTIYLAMPCGFFARVLLGKHVSAFRSLSTYLCQDRNNNHNNTSNTNNNNKDDKNDNTNNNQSIAPPPMMYFILDQDDQFTSPQTLVDILNSFPFPTNDDDKKSMLQLLKTRTGHFFRGYEHILALLISTYFCNSIQYYDATIAKQQPKLIGLTNNNSLVDTSSLLVKRNNNNINHSNNNNNNNNDTKKTTSESTTDDTTIQRKNQQQDTKDNKNTTSANNNNTTTNTTITSNDEKNDNKKTKKQLKSIIPPPPKTTLYNPSVLLHSLTYRDDPFRVYFYDMNLWIPLLIIILAVCKGFYNHYEAHIKRELNLDGPIGAIVDTAIEKVIEEVSNGM